MFDEGLRDKLLIGTACCSIGSFAATNPRIATRFIDKAAMIELTVRPKDAGLGGLRLIMQYPSK